MEDRKEGDFVLDNEKAIEEAHKKLDELTKRLVEAFRHFLNRVEKGRLAQCDGCLGIFTKRELQRCEGDSRLLCAECAEKLR